MRNRTFDLFKWAAALFVLLLHVPFPGDVGGTVRMFARWAVPFFFMVSGYFTYGAVQREDAGRLVRRIRRLLRIFVPAAGFYALWCCFLLSDKTPAAFFKSHYAMENVISFFLLNNTQSKPHLWFIPALIYCYGVVLLLMKMHRTHWLRWAPLLLLVPLVLGEVVVGMLHREVAAQYSRNAWFTGLPCFALGLLFKEAETQIKRLGRKWPALGVLVGLALSVLEYRYLNDSADLYFGPLVAAVSLFFAGPECDLHLGKSLCAVRRGVCVGDLHFAPGAAEPGPAAVAALVGCARHGGRLAVAGTDLGAGAAGCGNLVVA